MSETERQIETISELEHAYELRLTNGPVGPDPRYDIAVDRYSALKAAHAALREKQAREKGCEFCNSRFGIATHHVTDSGMQAGTNKNALLCPMCGRRLEVKQDG